MCWDPAQQSSLVVVKEDMCKIMTVNLAWLQLSGEKHIFKVKFRHGS